MTSPWVQRMVREEGPIDDPGSDRCDAHAYARTDRLHRCKRSRKVLLRVEGNYPIGRFCRQHGLIQQDRAVARVMDTRRVTLEEIA